MNTAGRIALALVALSAAARAGSDGEFAAELAKDGDRAGAAIEYRRLALRAEEASERAGYFWAAAWEYSAAGDPARSESMLDRAEDEWPAARDAASALRGANATALRRHREAAFFYEGAAREAEDSVRSALARHAAAAHLRGGNTTGARAATAADAATLAEIDAYLAGRDKSPSLGGWLGTIPGMGYAYAGEYANALRSLILNSLFIWGMVETAEDEHWGGFAAITFFEITWYTGSIYGGVDASHRFNRRRLDRTTDALVGETRIDVDREVLPAIRLRVEF